MPTTTMTPDQANLANMMAQYNYYLNPAAYGGNAGVNSHYTPGSTSSGGGIPSIGGLMGLDDTGQGISDLIDPFNMVLPGFGLFNMLFGGDKKKEPEWQPYATEDGKFVWTTPQDYNPVPLSNVPGAQVGPSQEYIDMANQVRAITDLLPQYSQAISAQKIPDALGQLAADTATTGPRLALQEQLQRQYGPIFDQLAAESNRRKSMASAENDLSVLQGPGKDLVAAALEAAKQYDPEYFATRTATSDSLAKLLGSATGRLGQGLSKTEEDQMARGLALTNSRAGTANAPSNLTAAGNAMQFGQAGRQRELENENQLSKAIAASTAFLPQSRSNVDVFQVATGKPSYNQQDSRFNTTGNNNSAEGQANALLNTGTSMWTTNQNNALTRELNETNWMDTLSAITGAIGSVGGAVGGMMCWIAREVYGDYDIRWIKFRHYLCNHAPRWFYNWYRKHGEQFAQFISDKPLIKRIIRLWMNRKIRQYAHI